MLNNKFQNVQCNSADFEHARFFCANVASSEMKIFVQNIFWKNTALLDSKVPVCY